MLIKCVNDYDIIIIFSFYKMMMMMMDWVVMKYSVEHHRPIVFNYDGIV